MVAIIYGPCAFEGMLSLSREFYNPKTKDYIKLEACEDREEDHETMIFQLVAWVPDGGYCPFAADHADLHTAVQWFQEYSPPEGFVEMEIPKEAYC